MDFDWESPTTTGSQNVGAAARTDLLQQDDPWDDHHRRSYAAHRWRPFMAAQRSGQDEVRRLKQEIATFAAQLQILAPSAPAQTRVPAIPASTYDQIKVRNGQFAKLVGKTSAVPNYGTICFVMEPPNLCQKHTELVFQWDSDFLTGDKLIQMLLRLDTLFRFNAADMANAKEANKGAMAARLAGQIATGESGGQSWYPEFTPCPLQYVVPAEDGDECDQYEEEAA